MVAEPGDLILACFLGDLTCCHWDPGQGWSWPSLHLFSMPAVSRMPGF